MLGPPVPTDRTSSLELVRITEAAAISAAHWMGHGDNDRADAAAVEAMRKAMDEVAFHGTVVIGEGERDEAPMLYIGEKVGRGDACERACDDRGVRARRPAPCSGHVHGEARRREARCGKGRP